MPRTRTLVVSLILAAIVALLPASAQAAGPSRAMVRKINAFRAERGLPRLRTSPALRSSADRYARTMMDRDYFGHAARIQASSLFSRKGEVLAAHPGRRALVSSTLGKWKMSPGHRAILLDRSFRWIGAGRDYGRLGARRTTIWVVHVGTR
jgi:uncharacterized protein YkwD